MRFHRFLRPECIRIGMASDALEEPSEELPEERREWSEKESVIEELVEVLAASGEVANVSKLQRDLLNVEKRTTTGIGDGIAIPHVRTLRERTFVMGFCRSERGLRYASVDAEPVRLFFPMIAPPHDDKLYHRVLGDLATILLEPGCRELLEAAETPDEVIWGLQTFAP
ncbi:MAG: PTS sugar transporter subunit IIA [Planctomycetota bacterium]